MANHPYENVPTPKLKFAFEVGEAGLKMWPKRSAAYKECVRQVEAMRDELAQREVA